MQRRYSPRATLTFCIRSPAATRRLGWRVQTSLWMSWPYPWWHWPTCSTGSLLGSSRSRELIEAPELRSSTVQPHPTRCATRRCASETQSGHRPADSSRIGLLSAWLIAIPSFQHSSHSETRPFQSIGQARFSLVLTTGETHLSFLLRDCLPSVWHSVGSPCGESDE